MLKWLENTRPATRLVDTGVVRAQGADAVKFLQGQVSNDVARVSAERSVLAGLHNAQGRAIALLRLVLAGPDEILALLPRELAAPVATRLAKFVLRAKVKIADVSAEWNVAGVEASDIAAGLAGPSVDAARRDEEGKLWICVAGTTPSPALDPSPALNPSRTSRWLVASRTTAQRAEPRGDDANAAPDVGSPKPALSREEWRALDIAAGIPQIYAATSEAFVAQMLNLDVLDGIAFDKGCYTGQEVIVRALYRGKVKRRMQRFRTSAPARLNPADSGTLGDGRSFKVVDAVQLNDGRCEFLAVTTFGDRSSDVPEETGSSENATAVNAEQLPLPYSLPA